ncbi:unnamed protein product [Albugo candida]|uniref:Uncharacterized protein n=1 Tax=Albugo candida TaxID=65357 RepID=A0A024FU00_9STRA|nr:unnamed protein product [Albugo candida]|eukprot:CCI10600.1 unnamed protein product [Albugo candida]
MRLGLNLIENIAHWSFAYSPSSAQMLRALAILLSLVCLNAQPLEDAGEISSPPDVSSRQTLLEEFVTEYKDCFEERDKGRCKNALRIITNGVKGAIEQLRTFIPARQRMPHSPASEHQNSELQSEICEYAEGTFSGGPIKELCVKTFEAFRTTLENIAEHVRTLPVVQDNPEAVKAFLIGQSMHLLAKCSMDERPRSLCVQTFLVVATLYLGKLTVDEMMHLWEIWKIWYSNHALPIIPNDANTISTAGRSDSTEHTIRA